MPACPSAAFPPSTTAGAINSKGQPIRFMEQPSRGPDLQMRRQTGLT
jgi:hypothetical protein